MTFFWSIFFESLKKKSFWPEFVSSQKLSHLEVGWGGVQRSELFKWSKTHFGLEFLKSNEIFEIQ